MPSVKPDRLTDPQAVTKSDGEVRGSKWEVSAQRVGSWGIGLTSALSDDPLGL